MHSLIFMSAVRNNTWIGNNYVFILVMVGAALLGLLSGSFGVIAVLRKESLMSEGIAHATLPGVLIAFMIFKKKILIILLLGAVISGAIMILIFRLIKKYTKLKKTTILATLLAGFFGFGQVLISIINDKGMGARSGLEEYIFGQLAYISKADVYTILGVGIVVFILLILFKKEIVLQTFDPVFFASLGHKNIGIDILISLILIVCTVFGIQAVGIIPVCALLVIPAFVSRQWSSRYTVNFIIAGIIGMMSGVIGSIISHYAVNFPPGPAIVIFLAGLGIISMLFSPKQGIAVQGILNGLNKQFIKKYHYLIHVYSTNEVYDIDLNTKKLLLKKKYINEDGSLTDLGMKKADKVFKSGVR